ncbi:hypothetical protein K469DRAFT_594249, partial [Zopfia rhizophila CBS 207.26]
SIPNGIGLVTSVANKNEWSVTATEDSSIFTAEGLSNYTSLVFIHTTGDFLVDSEYEALYQYLVNGGSWLGIHAGSFLFSCCGNIRPDIITIRDSTHPSTVNLPQSHNRTDEWYSYRTNPSQSANYTVLATLNETYIDDITPAYLSMVPDHPISWYSLFEGKARAWYTGMGHTVGTYSEEYFIEHVTKGLEWVVGLKN